jgi:hypothetical protein
MVHVRCCPYGKHGTVIDAVFLDFFHVKYGDEEDEEISTRQHHDLVNERGQSKRNRAIE